MKKKLTLKRVCKYLYIVVAFALPIALWTILSLDKDYSWDLSEVLFMFIITTISWGTAHLVYQMMEHIDSNNSNLIVTDTVDGVVLMDKEGQVITYL